MKSDGEPQQVFPLVCGDPFESSDGTRQLRRKYSLVLPAVMKPFEYRVEIGDSQTRVFHVRTGEKAGYIRSGSGPCGCRRI